MKGWGLSRHKSRVGQPNSAQNQDVEGGARHKIQILRVGLGTNRWGDNPARHKIGGLVSQAWQRGPARKASPPPSAARVASLVWQDMPPRKRISSGPTPNGKRDKKNELPSVSPDVLCMPHMKAFEEWASL